MRREFSRRKNRGEKAFKKKEVRPLFPKVREKVLDNSLYQDVLEAYLLLQRVRSQVEGKRKDKLSERALSNAEKKFERAKSRLCRYYHIRDHRRIDLLLEEELGSQ